jgi:uncharacterized protein (DUF433 family)
MLALFLDSRYMKRQAQEMDYRDRITVDPSVRSEKLCIRGTRITVADVFDYLGGGMSIAGILDDFPDLTDNDIRACFAFAPDRDRRMHVLLHEVAI